MKKKPFITLIIPLYNNEQYIEQTLISIIKQTEENWECIIIDDESKDASISLVNEKIKLDNRFIFINRKDHNNKKGANVCRNIGLLNTNTNYVMFVDADDYLDFNCLKLRLNFINKHKKVNAYIFKTAFVNNENKILRYFNNPNEDMQDIIVRLIDHKIPWHTMSPIWSVKFLKKIGGWNENYERLQDVELNLRALLNQAVLICADTNVDTFYRFNEMTDEKREAARMGFTRLIKDYYTILIGNEYLDKIAKEKIIIRFQNVLEGQFLSYVKSRNTRNLTWEELYLKTLQIVEIEIEEREKIKSIFSKL